MVFRIMNQEKYYVRSVPVPVGITRYRNTKNYSTVNVKVKGKRVKMSHRETERLFK